MSIESKVLVCIYTHEGSSNRAYLKWLDRLDRKKIDFVITSVKDKTEISNNKLFLEIEESYSNLPLKTLTILKKFLEFKKYSHLIKIDDDVDLKEPNRVIEELIKFDYSGNWIYSNPFVLYKWKKSRKLFRKSFLSCFRYIGLRYATGPTYVVSRKTAELVVSCYKDGLPESLELEDVMLGLAVELNYKKAKLNLPKEYFSSQPSLLGKKVTEKIAKLISQLIWKFRLRLIK